MIYVAGDHKAVELVDKILEYLKSKNVEFENLGATSSENVTPLQDIIPAIADTVKNNSESSGILACGTGAGVEIGANRFKGIRASLCRDAKQAEYARIYDSANVLCLGSWFDNDVPAILDAWLSNKFDGDKERTKMLEDFDSWN